MTIEEYVNAKIEANVHSQNYHIGKELKISSAMLSHYRTGHTRQPSLELARRIYQIDNVTIYPYSVEAVQGEDND